MNLRTSAPIPESLQSIPFLVSVGIFLASKACPRVFALYKEAHAPTIVRATKPSPQTPSRILFIRVDSFNEDETRPNPLKVLRSVNSPWIHHLLSVSIQRYIIRCQSYSVNHSGRLNDQAHLGRLLRAGCRSAASPSIQNPKRYISHYMPYKCSASAM